MSSRTAARSANAGHDTRMTQAARLAHKCAKQGLELGSLTM